MEFVPRAIEEYCERNSSKEDDVLYELLRRTFQEVLQPRMLSGHLQGQALTILSKMSRPKFILEIGTYTGYSAICLARGLKQDGKMLTIDKNEELEDFANEFFEKAGLSNKIEMRIGDAQLLIPEIEDEIDIVFLDADKDNYSNYFDLVIDKMSSGGVIIADNVLWSGKVLEEPKPNDKETKGLLDFAKKVNEDSRVESVMLPIRDGLQLIRKL